MSLFFTGERRTVVEPVDLVPDWDAALASVAKRESAHMVSAKGQLTIEQARKLAQDCRQVEPMLLDEMKAGRCTTQATAVDFLRSKTDGFFPAVKFCTVIRENVGSEAVPATWAQVVTAAQTEAA